jgi:hypothetical protein
VKTRWKEKIAENNRSPPISQAVNNQNPVMNHVKIVFCVDKFRVPKRNDWQRGCVCTKKVVRDSDGVSRLFETSLVEAQMVPEEHQHHILNLPTVSFPMLRYFMSVKDRHFGTWRISSQKLAVFIKIRVRVCIQKFPNRPPVMRTANGTALCH